MRYPQAIWAPGPPEKTGYTGRTVNTVWGAVLHSMVGQYAGALSRLMGPDRASWHFSVLKNGDVFQHYDTTAVCWHAGNPTVNSAYIGIEHEGGGPGSEREPLTPEQLAASLHLVRWLSETQNFPLNREHLREHNEFYATACPSGRIPWSAYTEDGMDEETRAAIGAILLQLGNLGADLLALTKDVQGTFRFVYEHVSAPEGHGTIGSQVMLHTLDARLDELERRVEAGAAEMEAAGRAFR